MPGRAARPGAGGAEMENGGLYQGKIFITLLLLFLVVLGGLAVAGCVPVGVGEWLDTNAAGSPGLLGYHHRLKRQEFSCKRVDGSSSRRIASMFFYVDLPPDLEMAEYASEPPSFDAKPGSQTKKPGSEKELYTILYVAKTLSGKSLEAARALLATGKVEILMAKHGVEVPNELVGEAQAFFWVQPSREDGMLGVGDVPLPLVELNWAVDYFFFKGPE